MERSTTGGIRGIAVAVATAAAVTGVAVGVNSWAAEVGSRPAPEPVASQAARAEIDPVLVLSLSENAMREERVTFDRVVADRKVREAEAARVAAEAAAAEAAAAEAARLEAEAAAAEAEAKAAEERAAEEERASRSDRAEESTADVVPAGSAKDIARAKVEARGWDAEQFSCLDKLWEKESNWDHTAENPSSGAYGIPQALPGSKMASAGDDWRTNPATQIEWGLGYIADRYGTPCEAWSHSQAKNWY